MRGHDAPALCSAHPGLALAAGFGAAFAAELAIGSRKVGAIGGDLDAQQFSRQALRRAACAESLAGCCSEPCRVVAALPEAEQKRLRQGTGAPKKYFKRAAGPKYLKPL